MHASEGGTSGGEDRWRSGKVVRGRVPERYRVMFWAERDAHLVWGSCALVILMMLPLIVIRPWLALGGVSLIIALAALNLRAFRLELTDKVLFYKPGMFGREVTIPFHRIEAVDVIDLGGTPSPGLDDDPKTGHVVVKAHGEFLAIAGVRHPRAFADAVRILQRRANKAP